jgi:hypothetical protein
MLSRSISKSIGLRSIDNPLIIHAVSNAAKNHVQYQFQVDKMAIKKKFLLKPLKFKKKTEALILFEQIMQENH